MPNQVADRSCDDAGAPEQQDQAEPDHERRRDDRQDGEHAQRALGAEAGARAMSAKARPSAVVPKPPATPRNSVFQATPQRNCAAEAVEAPDRPVGELGHELAGREAARIVLHRADQDLGHRVEHEQQDQADHGADRRRPRTRRRGTSPRAASPRQRMNRNAASSVTPPGPCRPAWARARRTARSASGVPAPQSDAEALSERQGKAQHAGGEQAASRASAHRCAAARRRPRGPGAGAGAAATMCRRTPAPARCRPARTGSRTSPTPREKSSQYHGMSAKAAQASAVRSDAPTRADVVRFKPPRCWFSWIDATILFSAQTPRARSHSLNHGPLEIHC